MKSEIMMTALLGIWAALPAASRASGDIRGSPAVSVSTPAAPRRTVSPALLRPQAVIYKYREPMDLIELVPVLRDINRLIPRQFSLADHQLLLDPDHVTIRHEFLDAETRRRPKSSIISFSYTGGMGQRLGTKLDVPLFYSSIFGFSNWSSYPLGNYTMTIDRAAPFQNENVLYIRALTRF